MLVLSVFAFLLEEMTARKARILILCKTYPSPSSKHAETTCVAGLEAGGNLVRLFPIPFRLIGDDQQFKKWQWVEVMVAKAKADHRGESHSVYVDTIKLDGKPVGTEKFWRARRELLASTPVYDDFVDLEQQRQLTGRTLGLIKPHRLVSLEITPVNCPEWTPDEIQKLRQYEAQAALFSDQDNSPRPLLKKLPFDFHYTYECRQRGGAVRYRHKIVDWEAGALFWNCRRYYGDQWEKAFRAKLEADFVDKDLMFLMGTIHRFPDKWLIVSLIYPPKLPVASTDQGSLFDQ